MAGDEEQIAEELKREFPDLTPVGIQRAKRVVATVPRAKLFAVCKHLKEKMRFDHCSSIASVDWLDHFEVIYAIYSYERRQTVVITVEVPHVEPEVDSVESLWWGANWHEREQYDLMGIKFTNHPYLKRLILPDGWEVHPLRKDYKAEDVKW